MAANPLLAAFKANKPAFGAWLTTGGFFHVRTFAQASPHLTWVVIDCEHGLIPLVPGAAESIAAIHGSSPEGGPSAVVRIPATGVSTSTSWQIKYALDAGARGVLVPMVGYGCFRRFLMSHRLNRSRRPRRLKKSSQIVGFLQLADAGSVVHSRMVTGE
jgi:2-keto-3-deoxy-L-rhamnonate aldolase RhmA